MRRTGSSKLPALTLWQAFWIASVAKCIATLLTYPIIRVKVLMIASQKGSKVAGLEKKKALPEPPPPAGEFGLLRTGQTLYASDGFRGFYSGCTAQLVSTTLKGAIQLVTKEQVEGVVYRSLYALRKVN